MGWAPRRPCLCAGPGPRRAAGWSQGRDWPESSAPVITRVTVCLFSHLRGGFISLGELGVGSNDSLKDSKF